jgi:anti-sigma regulatory factor (Ser/Thr protein kinase)
MSSAAAVDQFRHEALLYSSNSEFLAGTVPFITEGLSAGEAIMVVEPADKISLLRAVLGGDADGVHFADMAVVGANPALIIPAWQEFTAGNGLQGRRMRGIGEPIFSGRRPAELLECQRHEALLNIAFDRGLPWWLLCPYDISVFGPAVINEARRSHPFVREGPTSRTHGDRGMSSWAAPYEAPLPPPPPDRHILPVTLDRLDAVRELVSSEAARAGLAGDRVADVVVAANEVATNSVRHAGEPSVLRVWRSDDALVCEISDRGHIARPLADRERPAPDLGASRGLWLANHLCDLVQIQTSPGATTVRLHMWLEQAPGS